MINLYNYQKQWIDEKSKFQVGMFARQSGKSFATSCKIILSCLESEANGSRERWVILSRGERQAREVIEEGIKFWTHEFNAIIECIDSTYKGDDGVYKTLEVMLPGGSRVTAVPSNPDTARGYSANLFLDEFAFHQDSRKIWGAAYPIVSKNDLKLLVCSTPNGRNNKFYELITSKDLNNVFYRQIVDIYTAVNDGLERNVNVLKAGLNDDDLWAQEYELKWIDDASSWLSFDLINSAENENAGIKENYEKNPCFVGVDIGVRNNLFVVFVLELVGDVFWTREIIRRKGLKFAEMNWIIDGIFREYNVARCCMDQTAYGENIVEDQKYKHGSYSVEGIIFTLANKLIMANRGRQVFEDKLLRIPMGDQILRSDLHKLRRVSSPTGSPRFVASDDAEGHADQFWALCLALYAAQDPVSSIDFTEVSNYSEWNTPELFRSTKGAW